MDFKTEAEVIQTLYQIVVMKTEQSNKQKLLVSFEFSPSPLVTGFSIEFLVSFYITKHRAQLFVKIVVLSCCIFTLEDPPDALWVPIKDAF